MGRLLAALAVGLAVATAAADVPSIPAPAGFVTDTAGVIGPDARRGLERLLEELRAKTGSEIAVLTVETTAPFDDFTYALRVAEAWKPGRRKDDTGLVVLVAVRDRKVRVLTGYGIEGILPDGLVGQIQDEAMVPAFREGRLEDGLVAGVREFAARIAAAHGVTLTGVPPPRARTLTPPRVSWTALVVLLLLVLVVMYLVSQAPPARMRGRRRGYAHGGWPGGFGGGFGGGGGGFGGFGGGSFGGGGAGRSW
jgi:uncharacterized protein